MDLQQRFHALPEVHQNIIKEGSPELQDAARQLLRFEDDQTRQATVSYLILKQKQEKSLNPHQVVDEVYGKIAS